MSWCFPSNGKNSRTQTSKPTEFTLSSQTHIASSGFVSRVYLAETNTDGLPLKLCKCLRLCFSMTNKEFPRLEIRVYSVPRWKKTLDICLHFLGRGKSIRNYGSTAEYPTWCYSTCIRVSVIEMIGWNSDDNIPHEKARYNWCPCLPDTCLAIHKCFPTTFQIVQNHENLIIILSRTE